MSADVVQIAVGTLQGLGASTVFVLALFIGFCVVFGFTKTKKTAGGRAVGRQEPGRADQPPADGLSARRPRRAGRPTSSTRRNFSRPPLVSRL